jgi:uncharacterized membrane protein YvbJ
MMETCTYPGCGYRAEFISKIHCRLNHGMEREKMVKKYGPIKTNNNITISNNPKKKGNVND